MTQSTTMTIRLSAEVKERLEHLAKATHRSKSFLASEAIHHFIEINEWQIREIEAAVSEADADDFASEEDVQNTFDRWNINAN